MKPDRLNAFTDGVIAIIITIMVLEIRVPVAGGLAALAPVLPLLAAYALSFVNVGIFWSNHHHMLQSVKKVNGAVLWANLALLFWLSLIPFVIRWIDEAGVTAWPVAAYGLVLVMAALSYLVLERALIAAEGDGSAVELAVGSRFKEWLSFALYSLGLAAAFLVSPYVSVVLYVAVAVTWLVPDRRFEQRQARNP
jgi:uncharacterized membrane protein